MIAPFVVDGTAIQFDPMFGHRQVTPTMPASIRGSGKVQIMGKRCCVLGDEQGVSVNATYQVPGYSPGTGVIRITSLGPANTAPTISQLRPVIVNGGPFVATFTPLVPAMTIGPAPTPEPAAPTPGTGRFLPGQMKASKM